MGQVEFRCGSSMTAAPLPPFWERAVESGHAPSALCANWQVLQRRCHDALGLPCSLFKRLPSDDVGTLVYHHDEIRPSLFNADQIVDLLLVISTRPFVEFYSKLRTLACGPLLVFTGEARVTPPSDYKPCVALVSRLVAYWADRYGARGVRGWFFEMWSEPNPKEFWTGTPGDCFKLNRCTVEAIREVDAQLRVGGPATAKNEWVEEFLDFCENNDLPADFVMTHHYPTDAFGNETDDTEAQLAKSRRSALREQGQDARRRAHAKPLYYSKWNTTSNSRDPLQDEPHAAAFTARTVMGVSGIVEGHSLWTVSDIFEEIYFPYASFHGGFGPRNLHGTPKPAYRALEMLHRNDTEQLLADGSYDAVDAWVVSTERSLTGLPTSHELPRYAIKTEQVQIQLTDIPERRATDVERNDHIHANAEPPWRAAGASDYLSMLEVRRSKAAWRMCQGPQRCESVYGSLYLDLALPPQPVAAITIEFAPEQAGGGVAA